MTMKMIVKTGITSLVFIFIFKALTYMPNVENFIKSHPYYIILGAVALFASQETILTKLGLT